MRAKPALTVPKELFYLRFTNPIMLIVVKNRDEDLEVRQQIS